MRGHYGNDDQGSDDSKSREQATKAGELMWPKVVLLLIGAFFGFASSVAIDLFRLSLKVEKYAVHVTPAVSGGHTIYFDELSSCTEYREFLLEREKTKGGTVSKCVKEMVRFHSVRKG